MKTHTSEQKKAKAAYMKKYMKAYWQRPEVKQRLRERRQLWRTLQREPDTRCLPGQEAAKARRRERAIQLIRNGIIELLTD
jgi:hypothetical protein